MTKQKLIDKLELIVADDASVEMEMKAAFSGRITKRDYREAVNKVMRVYQVVHSHNPKHSCYNVHGDWRRL